MTVPPSKAKAPPTALICMRDKERPFAHQSRWLPTWPPVKWRPPESQVGSVLPFVRALPVLLRAALWCSQQRPFLAALQPAGSTCWNVHPAPNGGLARAYAEIKHPLCIAQTVIMSACVRRKVTAASTWSVQRIACSDRAGEERGCHIIENNCISPVNTCTAAATD